MRNSATAQLVGSHNGPSVIGSARWTFRPRS